LELQTWAKRFIVEFKLDIPELALCVDRLPNTRYGHFRHGHNGFGLKGEVAINTLYMGDARRWWEILGTLLHELLHAWQQAHGKPSGRNHHNAEFRAKAAELGMIVDRRGVTGYSASSDFKDLLRQYNVEAPAEACLPKVTRPKSRSKHRKYTCGCSTIRVAQQKFAAKCLLCGNDFAFELTHL
jgi:predicted SprT family Zn-dependent metalloprotease